MSRSETKKILKYIKKGSVSKLRNFVKRHNVDLNTIHDSHGRSVLHLACYLGEGKVAKCLLRCGANPCITDPNGNTPLHTALEYTLEFNSDSMFLELVVPLQKKSKRVMHLKNSKGKTPEDLLAKLKKALKMDLLVEEDINMASEEVDVEKQEEQEWLEKLAFEESCENFYFKDDYRCLEETAETYDQWAERIRKEYYAKQSFINYPSSQGTGEKNKEMSDYANKKLTEDLEKEHNGYIESVQLKMKAKKLCCERDGYEEKCKQVFEKETAQNLTFWELPWPCHGSAADMVDKLAEWAGKEDKIKYLKEQRIRWHPDRFLHRCRDRINVEAREEIMNLVKQISQGINALISSL